MNIAIVKLSALGDIVHALVALQFIKQALPDAHIDWVVEARFAELLAHQPDINRVLTVNLKALKTRKMDIFAQIGAVRAYARANYDLVIDAQGLLKSAITARLLGKKVAGFDKDSIRETAAAYFYDVTVNCPYDANTIDRNAMVLAQPLGLQISREQILHKQPLLFFQDDTRLADFFCSSRKTIVLVIGSTWPSRCYPPEKFVQIAESLQQNCLVIWGNSAEKTLADRLASQSRFIRVLPALDLNSLKALIAHADLVIGNDTGPTHIAWALNRPSITLFGCTPVSRVYQTDINKVLKSPSLVNPYKLNKQDFSIRDINAQAVIELANTLLFQ